MSDSKKTAAKEKPAETAAAPDAAAPAGEAPKGPGYRTVPSPAPVDDSFADGVSGFTVGRNVLKLDMYRVVGYDRESGQEVRTHSHRLVLPLTAISELSTVLQQFEAAVNKMRAEQKS